MKAVGIKLLKSRLSEFLRLVKSGETILVTERGDVIAELRPTNRQSVARDGLEEALQELADRGLVTMRSSAKKDWSDATISQPIPGISSQEILENALRIEMLSFDKRLEELI